jgi:hypothetical protein
MLCGSKIMIISIGVMFAPKLGTIDRTNLKVIIRNEQTRDFHSDWYDNTIQAIFCVRQVVRCQSKQNICKSKMIYQDLLPIAPVNYSRDLRRFQTDAD